ncbi:MAG: hypothetical protein ACK41Y_01255 [Paracoccus hibiscisoli]|uniref:hypothetical protein n=1 Tax=Paracoccus hibiscisoli TaxID=2023261 RepID=UPI00391B8F76
MLISGLTGGWGGTRTAAPTPTETKTTEPTPTQTAPAAQGETAPVQQVAPAEDSWATAPATADEAPAVQATQQGQAQPAASDPERMARAVERAEREAAPASVSVTTGAPAPASRNAVDQASEEAQARSFAEGKLQQERLTSLAVRNYAAIRDLFRAEDTRMTDRVAAPDGGRTAAPALILKAA